MSDPDFSYLARVRGLKCFGRGAHSYPGAAFVRVGAHGYPGAALCAFCIWPLRDSGIAAKKSTKY